ncbi:MAG: MFS transporter [Candidatus Limnocylindrales bacterium]
MFSVDGMHRDPRAGGRSTRLIPDLDRNGRIVVAARALRSFGFGMNSVALGLYLAGLGLPGLDIGLIVSAAFAGSLALTVIIAGWGDRIGRRKLLMAGSALMTTAALIPLVSREPLLLAVIALSGMVAVSANESTGLQTVDQALLPQSVPDTQRTKAFAFYNLLASAAAALGALSVGLLPIIGSLLGLAGADIYAPAFLAYALIGVLTLALHARLDHRAETGDRLERRLAIGPSRPIVARMSLLFGLDSLASSLSVQSYLAYFLAARFGADPATASVLFFVAGLLTTISFPVAAWLSARIGLIATMVFTHIPSSVFLIGLAIAPNLALAALFLLARSALASMDVPARQSYTMAVVEPRERTATAGVTSLARALAQVPGPALAGAVLVPIGLGIPLVATGMLKIAYDLLLFAMFKSRPAPEEVRGEAETAPQSGRR